VDLDLPTDRIGVLPCQYLERAIAARVVDAGRFTIPEENVQPASLDLRLGEDRFHVVVSGAELELSREDGLSGGAIETDPPTLAAVLTGQLPLGEAIRSGAVAIEGSRREIERFLRLFPMPEPCPISAPSAAEAVAGGGDGTQLGDGVLAATAR
jgi:hypothetical protein